MPSTAPQQSTRGFVAPSATPIKKTPDITDIVGERRKEKEEKEKAEGNISPSNFEEVTPYGDRVVYINENEPRETQESSLSQTTETNPQPNNSNEISNLKSQISNQNFPFHWHTMFEQIFLPVPTIYFALKESLPEIDNNIIKVTVKNDIQKEHFEAKIRDVLEYLRTHFDEKIEDVVVETNEQMETKKIIYDVKDKLQNFKEQNEEFEDFMQILDLKIKD